MTRLGAFLSLLAILGFLVQPAAAQPREQRVERARSLFQQGAAAYQAGQLRDALTHMLEAQSIYRRPEFAYNIARVLERMGSAVHAISWFEVYLRHGRPSVEERADVQSRIAALRELEERVQLGTMANAPSDSEINEEARTFFRNGVAMFEQGEFEAAMGAFEYARRFHEFPELQYNMALTAERLERFRDALTLYRSYLRAAGNVPGRGAVEQKVRELRQRLR